LLVDTDDNINWLLKPESKTESPAAGVREEPASQSARETAFWHIAEIVGMGHSIPQTELVWLNETQAAAIKMVPFSWSNMDELKLQEPDIARISLEPYRLSGELYKWAIIDFVLGNSDRHGGNLMVSPKDDGYKVVLIDHGSAFAGDQFAPGKDDNTWFPYYLRAWTHRKWSSMPVKDQLKACPRLPADREQELFHWLLGVSPQKLAGVMQRYGINAQPALARLAKLKDTREKLDVTVCKAWLGLI
jgi:hypothetical protein